MTTLIDKLSLTTRLLHSIIGFGMIAMIALGIYMSETEQFDLYDIHKSFGVLVFLLALGRVIWRFNKGWPETIVDSPKWQLLAAKFTHWALLLSTMLYPISGMMMSGSGGHGIYLFGLELIGSNYDPVTNKAIALNGSLAGLGHEIHGSITYFIIAIIVLHIAGALKHHVIDKDATVNRMF